MKVRNGMRAPAQTFAKILTLAALIHLGSFAHADIDEDAPKAVARTLDSQLEIQVGSITYAIPKLPDNDLEPYRSLTEDNRRQFESHRTEYLTRLARVLSVIKYAFGIGALVRDQVHFKLESLQEARMTAEMLQMPSGVRDDFLRAREESLQEQAALADLASQRTMRERSVAITQRILLQIDHVLWQQAPLIATSNEYGVLLALGPQLVFGIKGKKAWGRTYTVGLSVGYNHVTKNLVLQIYRELERYKSSPMPALASIAVIWKAGLYVANQYEGSLLHKGITFYPPTQAFMSATNDNFMIGLSSGPGIPPSPFSDFMTYTNHLNQRMMVRLALSSSRFWRAIGLARKIEPSCKDLLD